MMKAAGYILAAMASASLVWGAEEVGSYAQGLERVAEDGWVLLCYSADWDSSHDEQWMRRQTAIRSACGNALVLYVPIYQTPTPEQAAQVERLLQGCQVDFQNLRSVPCAILLDSEGRAYSTISGENFSEHAAGKIREAQVQLRTRNDLLRQASMEEGTQKAQTLSRIWRLSIEPPPNLQQQMHAADPEDSAGIAEWSPFDPWKLAQRVRAMSWPEAQAEFERVLAAQLSKEERQAVLAIRIGCVRYHLGAAGAREIHNLATACSALAPGSPLGRAAQRAASLWGNRLEISGGWDVGQLPLIAAECEFSGVQTMARAGEFRIGFVPDKGKDPVRVTRVTLYDGETKISEDVHSCSLKAGEGLENHEYMLIVRIAPARPRLVVTFDQQGHNDTQGHFTLRYFNEDGIEEIRRDKAREAAEKARQEVSEREFDAHRTETPAEGAGTSGAAEAVKSVETPEAE